MGSRNMGNKIIWKIKGMHCASCVELVRQEISSIPGVEDVKVTLSDNRAEIYLKNGAGEPSREEADIKLSTFGFSIDKENTIKVERDRAGNNYNSWIKSFIAAAAVFAVFIMLDHSGIISFPGFSSAGRTGAESSAPVLSFFMGLAASVSSCLAVVGSVVISFSILYQPQDKKSFSAALVPNLTFQAGRIGGFAVMGGILGLIGGSLSITGPVLGMIEIFVVIILLAAAASLLGAGHIFEKIGLRLPSSVSKLMGRLKASRSPAAPVLLGALTFFLPCGFTQSMQAASLGSGSFAAGALIMLAFSLGTLPVLLAAGITAGWSRGKSSFIIKRAAGLLIAAFAVTTLFNAIPLFSYSGDLFSSTPASQMQVQIQQQGAAKIPAAEPAGLPPSVPLQAASEAQQQAGAFQYIEMHVTYRGFEPSVLEVKKGIPVKWTIWGDQVSACTNAIIIPSLKAKFSVRPGENTVVFTPEESGVINYSCWMGMVRGSIRVN